MKLLDLLKIIIPVCMVSPLQAQTLDIDDFSQYRKMMLPTLQKSIEPLEKTRVCVEQSKDSKQLTECVAIMMGNKPGAAAMPKMEWSTKLVKRLIADLDRSLEQTHARIKCIKASDEKDVMSACMRQAGF